MTQNVSVIGAGVIGVSCAWQLAKSGYTVTVYHHQPLGAGASGNAAGALKPFDALQRGWKQRLQQESLWQYPQFITDIESESGLNVGFDRCGRVAVYNTQPSFEKAQKAAAEANKKWPFAPAQSVLTGDDLLRYTPQVEQDAVGGIFCHATGAFTPQKLLEALVKCCKKQGVVFKEQTLDTLPEARPLVMAAGAFTSTLLPEASIKPIKRQAVLLEWPIQDPLTHITENGQVYLVPWDFQCDGGRAVYVGSTFEPEAGFDNNPTREAEAQLRGDAARLYPELATAKLLQRFSGLQSRGYGEGSTLKLGPLAGLEGVYVAAGHGGVGYCMAPVTAAQIVKLIKAQFPA